MQIGFFEEAGDHFVGNIVTFLFTAHVVIAPALPAPVAPDYRLYLQGLQRGSGWIANDTDKIRLQIDDPALTTPIEGLLIKGGHGLWTLEWTRNSKPQSGCHADHEVPSSTGLVSTRGRCGSSRETAYSASNLVKVPCLRLCKRLLVSAALLSSDGPFLCEKG